MSSQETYLRHSVTGIVIHDGKVLLARHTYGAGKGKLIVPGGYVEKGETPQEALIREYKEETGIVIEPENIIGIRFNMQDWYVAFKAKYISGTAKSDKHENNEVLWLDIQEALQREDVPDLTKKLIGSAISKEKGLEKIDYKSRNYPPFSFYGQK